MCVALLLLYKRVKHANKVSFNIMGNAKLSNFFSEKQ